MAGYRAEIAQIHPDWHNAPVVSFGDPAPRLLILGLAPGLRGAHRTGRAFTGDASGKLLFETLIGTGLARGRYDADGRDDLRLPGVLISNAVRCLPPQNRPLGAELAACRPHLTALLTALPHLRAVLCLGRVAHDSVLRSAGHRLRDHPFGHAARHRVGPLEIHDSYHCSRYNTQTGRLTPAMLRAVVRAAGAAAGLLAQSGART
ncbi:MAG: uracil-DNA glycosylase [Pseudomonadota bacterium]